MNRNEPLMSRLRSMWTAADPCPADLADRVLFRVGLDRPDFDELAFELMAVQAELAASGTRGPGPAPPGPEVTTTVIFESSTLSLTISVAGASGAGGRDPRRRIDGWISPSAALLVRLHGAGDVLEQSADEDGRFAFDGVPAGLVRFTVEPTPDAALRLDRPVATPHVAI